MNKFLVSSAFPNKNSQGVALGLARNGKLAVFITSFAFVEGSLLHRLASFFKLNNLLKRVLKRGFNGKLRIYPLNELLRRLPKCLAISPLISPDDVRRELDQKVSRLLSKGQVEDAVGVYVYADESYKIIQAAKKKNLCVVYELHIAYYKEIQAIIEAERRKNHEWVEETPLYTDSEAGTQIDKELLLADKVVVASQYTKRSLEKFGFDGSQVKVIPYGFPDVTPKEYSRNRSRIKLLFVGSLGIRKGLKYLIQALEGLSDKVELTIVGGGECSEALYSAIQEHRYINSLPHSEVLALMREADLFIFPTLSEGFGMVVTEAMSQGTPVITTPNGCGADLIVDGENGWLVPAADSEALRQTIQDIIANPSILGQVGKAALKTAESRSWEVYGAEVADFLSTL